VDDGTPAIPNGVQALQEGDRFIVWDEEGISKLEVITAGTEGVGAAHVNALPPCHDISNCPLTTPDPDCDDCGLLDFTFHNIVHDVKYRTASGILKGGCYCLLKELDDSEANDYKGDVSLP
jgi:hypothetical protein